MKMHLYTALFTLLIAGLAYGNFCPNGMPCDGECCQRYLYGSEYECCKEGYSCVYNSDFGACVANFLDIFKPKPENKFERHIYTDQPKVDSLIRKDEYPEENVIQMGFLKGLLKKIILV
ncbi:hypothetical protein CEXT_304732 [Caerostris extrusa]|uniref:Uncharacterized protein n=1 Tax=Caerostris extrusa TaxID=172846 RepID=A0AAV4S3U0_CAEEX|nr:hypothetical protein CEXT_304732 [Caerostris extrusa]